MSNGAVRDLLAPATIATVRAVGVALERARRSTAVSGLEAMLDALRFDLQRMCDQLQTSAELEAGKPPLQAICADIETEVAAIVVDESQALDDLSRSLEVCTAQFEVLREATTDVRRRLVLDGQLELLATMTRRLPVR